MTLKLGATQAHVDLKNELGAIVSKYGATMDPNELLAVVAQVAGMTSATLNAPNDVILMAIVQNATFGRRAMLDWLAIKETRQ